MPDSYDGDYWQESGEQYPWGPFDKDADLIFTFDIADWLASAAPGQSVGVTLASLTVLFDATQLVKVAQSIVGSTLNLRWKCAGDDDAKAALVGKRAKFTLRWKLSDNEQDDRTFILRIKER